MLQDANSKSWTLRSGFDENEGLAIGVAPRIHNILGRGRAGALAVWEVAKVGEEP